MMIGGGRSPCRPLGPWSVDSSHARADGLGLAMMTKQLAGHQAAPRAERPALLEPGPRNAGQRGPARIRLPVQRTACAGPIIFAPPLEQQRRSVVHPRRSGPFATEGAGRPRMNHEQDGPRVVIPKQGLIANGKPGDGRQRSCNPGDQRPDGRPQRP